MENNPENFFFWLQGFFELSEAKELTEKQIEIIKQHMALVVVNKTKTMSFENPYLNHSKPFLSC